MSQDNIEKMSDRRKKIKELYSRDDNLRLLAGRSAAGIASTLFSEEVIDRILSNISGTGATSEDGIKISNYAYATDPVYAGMIDYLANMYLWRYYFVPVKIRNTANESAYAEVYELMASVIDGLNIENIFPTIITKLLKDGVVYLYTERDTPSKTITTFLLNPRYCVPVMTSQYGTGLYQFDVRYFDSFGLSQEALEEILNLFPNELTDAYRRYKGQTSEPPIPGAQRYNVVLDGRFSTYISTNDFNFPKNFAVLKSVIDYNQYRKNEVEKSGSELDHVLTHEIPTHEDRILFEIDEVKELHETMARLLSNTKRIKLLTTFGKTEILPLQATTSVQNNTLDRANKAIYDKAGINKAIFTGESPESLRITLVKDSSLV